MLPKLLTQIFGSRNDRLLKQYRRVVERINALEPTFSGLDEAALKGKTAEFKERLAKGETLSQVAQRMCLSIKTVSTYRSRLIAKLKVQTNSELTYYALKEGLIE